MSHRYVAAGVMGSEALVLPPSKVVHAIRKSSRAASAFLQGVYKVDCSVSLCCLAQ